MLASVVVNGERGTAPRQQSARRIAPRRTADGSHEPQRRLALEVHQSLESRAFRCNTLLADEFLAQMCAPF
jgi:hypothetical protein